jgi:hypothetical protein
MQRGSLWIGVAAKAVGKWAIDKLPAEEVRQATKGGEHNGKERR